MPAVTIYKGYVIEWDYELKCYRISTNFGKWHSISFDARDIYFIKKDIDRMVANGCR